MRAWEQQRARSIKIFSVGAYEALALLRLLLASWLRRSSACPSGERCVVGTYDEEVTSDRLSGLLPETRHDFVSLGQQVNSRIDRQLGYFGNERFVFFYYEPRGEEVMWKDGRSYGFGTGAWETFLRDIAPLAEAAGASVGNSESAAEDVLLVDRATRSAYFAQRGRAEKLVAGQRASMVHC